MGDYNNTEESNPESYLESFRNTIGEYWKSLTENTSAFGRTYRPLQEERGSSNLYFAGFGAGLAVAISVFTASERDYTSTHHLQNLDNEPAVEIMASERDDDERYNFAVRTKEGIYKSVGILAKGFAVDADGDGDKDLVVKYDSDNLELYKQKGKGSNTFKIKAEDMSTEEIKKILSEKKAERLP